METVKIEMTVHGIHERLVQETKPHPTDETGWVTENAGATWRVEASAADQPSMAAIQFTQDAKPKFKVGDTIKVTVA